MELYIYTSILWLLILYVRSSKDTADTYLKTV